MTYTQVWDAMNNQVSDQMILRDENQAFIPFDPANIDYQDYLWWLDQGNEPTPYTPPAPLDETKEGENNGADTPIRPPAATVITSGGGAFDGGKYSRPAEPAARPSEHSRPTAPTQHGPARGTHKRGR
jgi:hypothetical protein